MLIVETDSDPALWFHMPLSGTKSEFAQWLDLQLDASALLHQRKLTWREKRQMKKFLEGSAAMLRDRVEADQAFLFGPMPPQAAPLVFFTKQGACDEEHSPSHLSMLAVPDPTAAAGQRVETTSFVSPHFGEGLRCLRSWTGPDGGLMLSVTYAWNDAAHNIELVLKGHYDDPALLEASFDAIDDFARSLRISSAA
ncbi:hypothetical protein [Streptomyces sporangiiformans]|uniref:Uncharacterized protein n=1 Tax=Streptomyces sporangiiformans TaxID=2315329 RepID=A0A505DC14_9ACTN|nr:hypothetical protein [Streptomyces sporangiiformans]TPQ22073.1 hypothetical protein FGD71_011810 [Streptomyces sporangiiformans]